MKFTKDKPTVPGFYFVKQVGKYPKDWSAEEIAEHKRKWPYKVVRVMYLESLYGEDLIVAEFDLTPVKHLKNMRWAGPIKEPEE